MNCLNLVLNISRGIPGNMDNMENKRKTEGINMNSKPNATILKMIAIIGMNPHS